MNLGIGKNDMKIKISLILWLNVMGWHGRSSKLKYAFNLIVPNNP